MSRQRLTVIIPSRRQPKQEEFLTRAVASIRAQSVIDEFDVRILVGVDAGEVPEGDLASRLGLTFVESPGRYAVSANNAAARLVDSGLIAFLEDDDQWFPQYLQTALEVLPHAAFVSSTTLEHDENDALVRIFDFPVPSGWLMPLSTFRTVGEFDPAYRFHFDNEWLGRLAETGLPRVHLVESTAPIASGKFDTRPWLANVLNMGGPASRLARHPSPYPLVRRLVHSNSGIQRIANQRDLAEISAAELAALVKRFGRLPW